MAIKTRFQKELSGELGEFWAKNAQQELAQVRRDLERGQITIDANGVAYNCIGRVVMSDMAEKIAYVTDKINVQATAKACSEEAHREITAYKAAMANHVPSAEEMYEMRAAFGEGATVVDIITGQTVQL